ncbi:MAG: hypothetical protein LC804_18780 [Acidobacteria bacterium]|nr:hypothetical protein [Acidobacteriota bacterium]
MRLPVLIVAAVLAVGWTAPDRARGTYQDLVSLFDDWRAFQRPELVNGVPDYAVPAMAAQHRELPAYHRRLEGIDPGRLADPAADRLAHRPR